MLIRVGTRRSDLARWQANYVSDLINRIDPSFRTIMYRIGSTGDRDRKSEFQEIGGIGVFTKESEIALLNDECDLVVHSLKDLPTSMQPGLILASVPEREDPRDCLCGLRLQDLKPGVRIGTGSVRRRAQLLKICDGLALKPIRGNVPPRLRKAKNKDGIDATLLAAAGLKRLGMLHEATEILDSDIFPYAVGQGALGIQVREGSHQLIEILKLIECQRSRFEVDAERAMLHHLQAGCSLPVGISGTWVDNQYLTLRGVVTSIDGKKQLQHSFGAPGITAQELGIALADNLISQGANKLLLEAERFVFSEREKLASELL